MPLQTRRRGKLVLLRRFILVLSLLLLALGSQQSALTLPPALAQEPTSEPPQEATAEPTAEPAPETTQEATQEPVTEPSPVTTVQPTQESTAEPTQAPTGQPTQEPTAEPTSAPTTEPTEEPSGEPAGPTPPPTAEPTEEPSAEPVGPILPTVEPSEEITPTVEPDFKVAAIPPIAPNLPPPVYFVNLTVEEFGSGDPINGFTYLVNEDNTGTAFDGEANQPSLKPMASYSPIVAAGGPANGATVIGLPDIAAYNENPIADELDRYLISVRAPGYKLWGAHVRFPDDNDPDNNTVDMTIQLRADPLPLASIEVIAFQDEIPVNGFIDPLERPLAGYHVVVEDGVGEVAVDWFGNPLCTEYQRDPDGTYTDNDNDGVPDVKLSPSVPLNPYGTYCITNNDGTVRIENIPGNEYEVFVIPPDNSNDATRPVQITTFEGKKRIEAWVEEGSDGRGAIGEFLAEPVVQTAFQFGFVLPDNFSTPGNSSIRGTIRNLVVFPPLEALSYGEPVRRPWIALNDIGNTDTQVYRGRGNPDGTFQINNVPAGTYQMVVWDEPLDYIMGLYTVVVPPNTNVNMGDVGIFRWFGWVSGYVFQDDGIAANGAVIPPDPPLASSAENGIRDCLGDNDNPNLNECERGIPGMVVASKFRDGSLYQEVVTNNDGYYQFEEIIGPLAKMVTMEVDFGRYAPTGHSIHRERFANYGQRDPNPIVINPDVGGNLILSQHILESKRTILDWGKVPYPADDPATPDVYEGGNGGISGVLMYATTRNEFNARLAAAESYEPGIPNVTMRLWSPVTDTVTGEYVTDPVTGEYMVDGLLNIILSDDWEHPELDNPDLADLPAEDVGCDVLDENGNPIPGGTADFIADNCLEVPMLGNETRPGAYDGGWAFADNCFDPDSPASADPFGDADGDGIANSLDPDAINPDACTPLTPGDYIVEVVVPPFYQVLKEEDQNTDEGDELVLPAFPPPPCVGPLHTVVDPRNPYNGQQMPLCNMKLVTLQDQQNAGAEFYLFTDADVDGDPATRTWDTTQAVPPPGRFYGLVEDDLTLNVDPNSITYGEKRSVVGVPIGIYDFGIGLPPTHPQAQRRLITTVNSDENGFYEVLLPSTQITSAPIPSGVAQGMYVYVTNDPGTAREPNVGYSPAHLTEPLAWNMYPGKMRWTDTPLDPINVLVCSVPPDVPALFVVNQPYAPNSGPFNLVVTGTRFGTVTQPPTVTLTLSNTVTTLALVNWDPADPNANPLETNAPPGTFEDIVTVTVPAGLPAGMYQLQVINPVSRAGSLNGLTFHVLGTGYNPPLLFVDPPTNPGAAAIQPVIDGAADGSLIIVRPGTYRENIILHQNVKLQGYGPGGTVGAPRPPQADPPIEPPDPTEPVNNIPRSDPAFAHLIGTVIDARFFQFQPARVAAWNATLAGADNGGPAFVPPGAGITVVAGATEFDNPAFRTQIDGFAVTHGRGEGAGGIYVHAEGENTLISNNVLDANSGRTAGGAIGLGRSNLLPGTVPDNNNDNIRIHHNRILGNGGIFFAGAIGVFNGANGYEIDHNDICGNNSSEYGGGISHFGLSNNGSIHDNNLHWNEAFDEGGGILIAGEVDFDAGGVGSGSVLVESNLILLNMSNDDGGGIRLLRPLSSTITIQNNFIINNVATDSGGGISLDDASDVRIVNNTIARNISTSTSVDAARAPSNAATLPSVAGLGVEPHSGPFAAATGQAFSNPFLFNNIFWENEAFRWDLVPGEPPETAGFTLVSSGFIDLRVFPGAPAGSCLDPRNSLLTVAYGPDGGACTTTNASNTVGADPLFLTPTVAVVGAAPFRGNPAEIFTEIARVEGTFINFISYHVPGNSPAIDRGVASLTRGAVTVNAPCDDYDDDGRPRNALWDVGADEQPGVSRDVTCNNVPASPQQLFFSTEDDTAIPGVPGASPPAITGGYDDADIYRWDGTSFSRVFDASNAGLVPTPLIGADIDALMVENANTFLMSFDLPVTLVPGLGLVQDEDIVRYDGGTNTWSLYFDGTPAAVGLGSTNLANDNEDVDAFEILADGSLVISTRGDISVPGVTGTNQDEDLLRCVPASVPPITSCTWNLYLNGSAPGFELDTNNGEDLDGVAVSEGNIYLSTTGNFGLLNPVSLSGGDEDVFVCNGPTVNGNGVVTGCASFSLYFDGSAASLPGGADLDAIDLLSALGPTNQAPVVNAGPDVELVAPVNSTLLAGTVTDDGQVLSTPVYTWSVTLTEGSGTVAFTPSPNVLNPTATFSQPGGYTLRLTAYDGEFTVFDEVLVEVAAGNLPAADLYLSFSNNLLFTVGNLQDVSNDMIVGFDAASGTFMPVFAGGDVGISGLNLTAFDITSPTSILMSFNATSNIPGAGLTSQFDVVRFSATSLGAETTGSFNPFFDGEAMGLTTPGEAIDSLALAADGSLLLSFVGNVSVPATIGAPATGLVNGNDEDVLRFTPATPGNYSSGSWSLVFDGSDVGLSGNGGEDIDGIAGDFTVAGTNDAYLSTMGAFSVGGGSLSGANEDVFTCDLTSVGTTTACTYEAPPPFFDGSVFNLQGNNVDGIDLP